MIMERLSSNDAEVYLKVHVCMRYGKLTSALCLCIGCIAARPVQIYFLVFMGSSYHTIGMAGYTPARWLVARKPPGGRLCTRGDSVWSIPCTSFISLIKSNRFAAGVIDSRSHQSMASIAARRQTEKRETHVRALPYHRRQQHQMCSRRDEARRGASHRRHAGEES